MHRYFTWITSHPTIVLCAGGIVAAFFGAHILTLTRDTSPDAFIPPNHPALERKIQVEEDFGLVEPIVVAVFRDAPGGVFNPHTLHLIRNLTKAIQTLPKVSPDDVISLDTEYGVFFDEDGLPGFSKLMGPEIPTEPAQLQALKNDVLGYELYCGTLLAADGSASSIIIRSRDAENDDKLYRDLNDLLADVSVKDERLEVAGEAAVRAHMGTAVSDDALRMNFICPLVMALLIIFAYRTGRGTVLPLSVIGGASALALGSMSIMDVPVYIITNGIFVVIMALGVADSVHLIGQYYEEQLDPHGRNKQEIIVDSCMALWRPLLTTSLTDIAGFFALFLVGIMPPIRYFGLFTCAGVIGALIFSYTVVPAGLMILPLKPSRAFGQGKEDRHDRALFDFVGQTMARLGSMIFQHRFRVLVTGITVLVIAAFGASKLVVNDARILAFKKSHQIARATETINQHFDGTSHLNIVIQAPKGHTFLEADLLREIEQLEAYTENTEEFPFVGGTHSISGWVKRAHQKMKGDNPEFYAIPENPDETKFYLDTLGGDLIHKNAAASPMARSLLEVINKDYTRANLIVRMRSSEFVHERELITKLQKHLDEKFNQDGIRAFLAGRIDLDYHWLKIVTVSHTRSVVFSFVCVLLLTGLMFKSVVGGLLCALTVGVAVLVNYAIMGFCGIPLGVGTSMFASISIGAGVDFPIHILDRLRVSLKQRPSVGQRFPTEAHVFENTLAFTGRALFFTAMIVAVGFLLLLFSQFHTLIRFGLLIGIGMVVSFLASVTLLPALVAMMKPRFLYGNRS